MLLDGGFDFNAPVKLLSVFLGCFSGLQGRFIIY